MTTMHYIGAAIVLLLITFLGVYSGKKVKSASDFVGSKKQAGAGLVAGSIIGSLVGGASTIGTAQLAFSYGFSAWWFTLGASLGCLVYGIFVVPTLYNSGISTLPQFFEREYGRKASTVSALLTAAGNFLAVASQVLSGVAMVTAITPLLGPLQSGALVVALMLVYVVFGGVWGAGIVGIVKTLLLYIGVGACGVMAFNLQGGWDAFYSALPPEQYFSLIARGAWIDLGSGMSLLLGVMTTQAYIQAAVSAKSLSAARKGVFTVVFLTPLIGVACIFIGMYMKLNFPEVNPASALPSFIITQTPPLLAGMILAALLVTVIGTGAGIALGLSSMICNDIYKVYINREASDKTMLFMSRFVIAIVLALSYLLVAFNTGTLILNWSYLSQALRAAVAFAPLVAAVYLPGRISGRFAVAAMWAGPVLVLVGPMFLPKYINPIFLGVACAIAIILLGYRGKGAAAEKVD